MEAGLAAEALTAFLQFLTAAVLAYSARQTRAIRREQEKVAERLTERLAASGQAGTERGSY